MTEPHGIDAAGGLFDSGAPLPKWSAQSVGNSDFAVVYGASASDVYLSGLRCTLLRSMDRGSTWKAIALPDCAPDSNGYLGIGGGSPGFFSIVGVAASSPLSPPRATIYWTTDSWQTASWQLDITSDAIPSGLVALGSTPTIQFAGDAHGKVIYSDNGGERWRSTGDTSLVRIGGVGAIAVLGAKEVWVAGGHTLTSGGAVLAHTKDGGATWTSTPLSAFPNALPSDTEMAAVWNASGTLWTSTISGRFYKSSDGGATWKGPLLTTGLGASQFWSSDANNVYAIVGTSIMHTIDGGKTWSQEASDLITANLSSIWGRAADEIYVAGVGGLVLRYAPAQ